MAFGIPKSRERLLAQYEQVAATQLPYRNFPPSSHQQIEAAIRTGPAYLDPQHVPHIPLEYSRALRNALGENAGRDTIKQREQCIKAYEEYREIIARAFAFRVSGKRSANNPLKVNRVTENIVYTVPYPTTKYESPFEIFKENINIGVNESYTVWPDEQKTAGEFVQGLLLAQNNPHVMRLVAYDIEQGVVITTGMRGVRFGEKYMELNRASIRFIVDVIANIKELFDKGVCVVLDPENIFSLYDGTSGKHTCAFGKVRIRRSDESFSKYFGGMIEVIEQSMPGINIQDLFKEVLTASKLSKEVVIDVRKAIAAYKRAQGQVYHRRLR